MKTITTTVTLIGTALALAGCSTNTPPAHVASSAGCSSLESADTAIQKIYAPGKVYAADAVTEKQFVARAIQPRRTMGADLYVYAEEGMTRQYVQRVLSCHAISGKPAHPNDPLHPSSGSITDVSVRSAGGSLAIRVVGDSSSTGQEIWQRARSIAGSGSVTVDQVASTGPHAAL